MAYLIEKYEKETPIKGVFFFDTNIWLNVLTTATEEQYEIKYRRFFEKVRKASNAKIAVSPLMFSELINRYMRNVAFPLYMKNSGTTIKHSDYKDRYRVTEDYMDALEVVCDDITGYSDSFVMLPNIDEELDLMDMINYPRLDLNDYMFYRQCQKLDCTIVTHDRDFFVEDAKVLTLNQKLLAKKMEQLIKDKGP